MVELGDFPPSLVATGSEGGFEACYAYGLRRNTTTRAEMAGELRSLPPLCHRVPGRQRTPLGVVVAGPRGVRCDLRRSGFSHLRRFPSIQGRMGISSTHRLLEWRR
jgi:hypothetical protein